MAQPKSYVFKEVSWLAFNARVLQEASDPAVPILERIKFLGIFSSNLDEFFRVRVGTLLRVIELGEKGKVFIEGHPKKVLKEIHEIVLKQQEEFEQTYQTILKELEKVGIHIINEKKLNSEQAQFVKAYFRDKVRPSLVPVMIEDAPVFPQLKDPFIYLAVQMNRKSGSTKYAIIEIPTNVVPRFVVLPEKSGKQYVILIDDVIRHCLDEIFSIFDYDSVEVYTIKLTRNAELDIENNILGSYIGKFSKSLEKRKIADPVRFIYDKRIPKPFLKFLTSALEITDPDSLIPSNSRYHNFKDFISFPKLTGFGLEYEPLPPLPNADFDPDKSLFSSIRKKDIMLHHPYQSFDYLIDLLREAAIDPRVVSIKISLYRVARNSNVINALINATRNGKAVTVVIELQARFDEEANIHWTSTLEEEGAIVIVGVPGIKVHSKLVLISRREKGKLVNYVNASTGNYNESTARIYADDSLFTADRRITAEVANVFKYIENPIKVRTYKHLIVSPFMTRKKFSKLLNLEIKNAKAGKKAECLLKLNNLVDRDMIKKIYKAAQAGVKFRLIVRGMCSLIPDLDGHENITAIGIIDRFLEHSRVYVFHNGGDEKYYISSADWMTRNIDHRVEVTIPIYDKEIQQELREMLEIQLRDNTKARIINKKLDNQYRTNSEKRSINCQTEIYRFLKKKHVGN